MAARQGETMNQHDKERSNAQGGDSDPKPESKMIILHLDDRVFGFNAQGGDSDPKPESKMIMLDVDDLNIQDIEENQVEPMKEALSDTSIHEQASETEHDNPSCHYCYSDSEEDEDKMLAQDGFNLMLLKKWDKLLAEKGIDVTKFKQANYKGECGACGEVDMHPDEDCP